MASMNLGQIANTLGYADAANFTRAFKRWTGRSPSQYWAGAPAVTIPGHPVNLCQ
jgi:AraC-like DNA-binding protein